MDERSTGRELDELLEHQAWVRGLAVRLVGDRDLAEDLAQETCVVALQQKPGGIQTMRAWLGTVLRNLVRERARSEGARSWREEESARPEALSSTYEVFERVTAHKHLVEALTQLPEHYRDVLLLRYFDGLTPTEIAARLSMPLSSVKTRLARGLAKLREDLDRQAGGDGEAWMAALAPLLGPMYPQVPVSPWPYAGGLKATVALLVIGVGSWIAWPVDDSANTTGPAYGEALVPARMADELALDASASDRELLAPAERTGMDGAGQGVSRSNPAPPADYPVAGKVVDQLGRPMPGLLLSFEGRGAGGTSIAVSDTGGEFVFEAARGVGTVRAMGEDVVTLFAGEAQAGEATRKLQVVVARGARLAGRVVDDSGAGVRAAEVAVLVAPEWMLAQGEGQGTRSLDLRFALTDSEGRFDLGVAIDMQGAQLQVRAEGYMNLEFARPAGEQLQLELVMQRAAELETDWTGRVVGSDGQALPDCRVAHAGRVTRTNAQGDFRFPKSNDEGTAIPPCVFSAWAPGFGPCVIEEPTDKQPLELRLPRTALEIEGHVLDEQGRAVSGLWVYLHDPTLFSFSGDFSGVLSYSRSNEQTLRSRAVRYEVLEDMAAGHLGRGIRWSKCVTDETGRFKLGGLANRDYVLTLFDSTSMTRIQTSPLAAGEGEVQLRFESVHPRRSLEGTLVDHRGSPVRGVRVSAWCRAFAVGLKEQDALTSMHSHSPVVSGEEGEFYLGELATTDVELRLVGNGWVSQQVSAESLELPAQIQMERSLALRVELSDPDLADSFGLLDGDGHGMQLILRSPRREQLLDRAPLVAGRSGLFEASELASQWVLFKDGREVQRLPFQFQAQGITQLEN